MTDQNRREFLHKMAAVTGGFVLLPAVSACEGGKGGGGKGGSGSKPAAGKGKIEVPKTKPGDWNAIGFNKKRGNAGSIPESYHASINGKDGDKKHLGKHLPYVPKLDAKLVPAGFVALMWGDPAKGHAKHPNAPKSDANKEGHWYNWIRIVKADGKEEGELKSQYSDWPKIGGGDNGKYVAFGGGDVAADSGKNTVYLAALPKNVKKGDTVRIWAHCLTHGEYVDFLTI